MYPAEIDCHIKQSLEYLLLKASTMGFYKLLHYLLLDGLSGCHLPQA